MRRNRGKAAYKLCIVDWVMNKHATLSCLADDSLSAGSSVYGTVLSRLQRERTLLKEFERCGHPFASRL